MHKYFLVLLAVILSGCTLQDKLKEHDAAMFFKVGGALQIDSQTDQLQQTTHPDQCDQQPKAKFGPGIETRSGHTLELMHHSWYFCGGPFNHKAEQWGLDLQYSYKFGGLK